MNEDEHRRAWGWTRGWVDVTGVGGNRVDLRAEDLTPGSRLSVEYKGQVYTVRVVPAVPENDAGYWRYIYEGERYRTLSYIATLITGDKTMSGNRFFRLRRRR